MSYTIRQMKEEDIPQIQKVAKISWNDTYRGIIPENIQNKFLQEAYNNETLLWRMEQSYFWIVEIEGEIAGFANFSPIKENGEVELGAIYLLPQYQGKGIGTALLQKGLAEIEGMKRLVLSVEKDNERGRHFYRAKGFHVDVEYDEIFYGHVLKTVRMVYDVKR